MKRKQIAVIAGGIGILAIILALVLMSNQESDMTENTLDKNISYIKKLQEESDYVPLPKEWQGSGPFRIDRNEYAIGEKIFIVIEGLDEKGQIDIMRPLNGTNQKVWDSIPFDGAGKSEFNFYFQPKMSEFNGICSVDNIIGKWSLIFRGTNHANLDFEINEKVVPGTDIEPVC